MQMGTQRARPKRARSCRHFTPTGKNPAPARVFDYPSHWRVLNSRHGRVLFLAEARDAPPVLILRLSGSPFFFLPPTSPLELCKLQS
jgi:hypothetical protein